MIKRPFKIYSTLNKMAKNWQLHSSLLNEWIIATFKSGVMTQWQQANANVPTEEPFNPFFN